VGYNIVPGGRMKLSKKRLVKLISGLILGGLAGLAVSFIYGHFGAT